MGLWNKPHNSCLVYWYWNWNIGMISKNMSFLHSWLSSCVLSKTQILFPVPLLPLFFIISVAFLPPILCPNYPLKTRQAGAFAVGRRKKTNENHICATREVRKFSSVCFLVLSSLFSKSINKNNLCNSGSSSADSQSSISLVDCSLKGLYL